jgi:hypothetical protein
MLRLVDGLVGICHLLYNSMSPLTKAVVSASFSPDYLAFPSPLFAKKGGAYHVKHTLPIEIGTPSQADPRRHSLLSQFLATRLGGAPPTINLIISMLTPAVILYPSPTITVLVLVMDN